MLISISFLFGSIWLEQRRYNHYLFPHTFNIKFFPCHIHHCRLLPLISPKPPIVCAQVIVFSFHFSSFFFFFLKSTKTKPNRINASIWWGFSVCVCMCVPPLAVCISVWAVRWLWLHVRFGLMSASHWGIGFRFVLILFAGWIQEENRMYGCTTFFRSNEYFSIFPLTQWLRLRLVLVWFPNVNILSKYYI